MRSIRSATAWMRSCRSSIAPAERVYRRRPHRRVDFAFLSQLLALGQKSLERCNRALKSKFVDHLGATLPMRDNSRVCIMITSGRRAHG